MTSPLGARALTAIYQGISDMVKTIALLAGLSLFSTGAAAQGTQDPLEACYQGPDGAPRLECFNREMRRRHAADSAAAAAPAASPAAAATPARPAMTAPSAAANPPAVDTVGLQGADLRRKLREEGVPEQSVKPIVATIVRILPRSYGESAFELDNGETWEQAEVMDNLNVKPHDTVTIKPGILGAYFLSTTRSQRVRVHRIR
jgi:hypothetical protein